MEKEIQNQECCPKFNPDPWDGKVFEWENKKFIKDRVLTFFFMPLNFGQVMKRIHKKAEKAGAKIPDWVCLSVHTSKFNTDVYLATDKDVPGAKNVTLSGRFFSKVYEGDFKETGKWCKEFEELIRDKGQVIKKMYMWYTTCPKCAKEYGKNYVVIIAELRQ